MSWIFIAVAVLALILLIYVFYPSIKKIFSKKTSSDSIDFKQERKKEKESKKLARQEEKKRKLAEKSDKKIENKRVNVEIIENKIDLFKEESKPFEDPDTQVNYDNFDLDGFFENGNQDFDNKKREVETSDNIYSQNFNELFEEDFEEFKPAYSPNKSKKIDLSKLDFQSNTEIADFLSENEGSPWEENELRQQIEKLPNEMKALILSKFLDRKDD
jgi:hypothetical protein